jgi:hypothetical protein
MPDVAIWPHAACGYMQLSEAYLVLVHRLIYNDDVAVQLTQAQKAGWPSHLFHAGHFHMLVDPAAVMIGMAELLAEMEQARSVRGE